ncbi:hypothetical protein ADL22_21810 [Streptomyces sp. NRRL F-4489]|uniref:IclR family transcriptional regulator domain-containing protein n=1 Tax=Streptomyces sp. NRRL F-4489 TaxID=1609095 RepID=UPI000748C3A0|nr:IclR family transcriptional regulator C-terminal domain-containing protein [Streptomyces sp. NRRL F-4489]KUL37311.1 hypothetical protein ADL22_21810 [Streptomyces sp. NRRL F-4489]
MSRYDGHRGGAERPEPVVPAGLAALLGRLGGPPDFWDRPCGDFGPLTAAHALPPEDRQNANSWYRLGSKALARDELAAAADWLGAAAEAGHPGALFRMAALAARTGWERGELRFLVAEAARHGHGDARALLAAGDASGAGSAVIEDPQFIDEVRRGMAAPPVSEPALPRDAAGEGEDGGRSGDGGDGRTTPGTAATGGQAPPGAGGLVPVPAPRLGRVPGPVRPETIWPEAAHPEAARPEPGHPADAGHPAAFWLPDARPGGGGPGAHPGDGLLLPLPAGQPGPVLPPAADDAGPEPWWSANALRPAVLTDTARRTLAHADTPQQWQAAARALDILYLVDGANGITTRSLARRSGLAPGPVAWLLHWLRGQQLVSTVAGAHFPGPLMELTRRPEQRTQLLQQTLTGLRDHLGAAVYVSDYTDGDVTVLHTAHGPQAPPVREWVAFRDAAHASAVGKSLLAQLDFDGRMNHLARYRPIKLTDRTITNPRALFDALDGHGPYAAQFDLLEYSDREVCAAFPLGIPGQALSVALSLPTGQRHRLLPAARALSERSAGLLMALMLTDEATTRRPPPPASPPPPDGTGPAAAPGSGPALPRVPATQR